MSGRVIAVVLAALGVLLVGVWAFRAGDSPAGDPTFAGASDEPVSHVPASPPETTRHGSDTVAGSVTGAPQATAAHDARPGAQPLPVLAEEATSHPPKGQPHLMGRVHDPVIGPLVGHVVELWSDELVIDGLASPRREGRIELGTSGEFAFRGLRPGRKELRVMGPGQGDLHEPYSESRVPVLLERSITLDVPASGLRDVELIIPGHGVDLLSARVFYGNGEPAEHAMLDVLANSGEVHGSAWVQADGRLHWSGDLRTAHTARFRAGGHLVQRLALNGQPNQHLGIVQLVLAADVAGVVVDTSGAPVPGAHVLFDPASASRNDWSSAPRQQGRTDLAGRFRFRFREAAEPFTLAVSADGYVPAEREGQPRPASDPEDWRIVLERR